MKNQRYHFEKKFAEYRDKKVKHVPQIGKAFSLERVGKRRVKWNDAGATAV